MRTGLDTYLGHRRGNGRKGQTRCVVDTTIVFNQVDKK